MDPENYTDEELNSVLKTCYTLPNQEDVLHSLLVDDRRSIARYRSWQKKVDADIRARIQIYKDTPRNERAVYVGQIAFQDMSPNEQEVDDEEQALIADENARIQARINASR